jgi:membrane-associated phospholipid phosphatase
LQPFRDIQEGAMSIRLARLFGVVSILLVASLLVPVDARAETEWVTHTGDVMQIALPVIGGLSTLFTNPDPDARWDREGTKQFALSYGSAWGTTYTLKIIASKARPNGDNRTSFPSGHTMSAFAGAAFIDSRYGKVVGIPAYALAVFTGYSRVQSNWHYQDDVLAGASIGMLYAWNFVSPQPGKLALLPTVSAGEIGMTAAIRPGRDGEPIDPSQRGASYVFGFGPAYAITNVAASRGDGGNEFQLTDLEGNNDPTTTAVVTVGFPVSRRGRVAVNYGPFEARDRGRFGYDVEFGGQTFAAGTPVDSAWRYYDLFASYEHALLRDGRWQLGLGAGVGIMYSYTALQSQENPELGAVVDDTALYPYGTVSVGHYFSDRIGIEARASGTSLGDNWLYTFAGDLAWRAAQSWDFRLGYSYFGRQIETDSYYNKTRYGIPQLAVTRYW